MTIRLPIIALTEDSQKVMDDHYKKFVLEQEERLQKLQVQGEATEDAPAEQPTNETEASEEAPSEASTRASVP